MSPITKFNMHVQTVCTHIKKLRSCRKAKENVQIDEMILIYAYLLVNYNKIVNQPLLVQRQTSNHTALRHTPQQRRRYAASSPQYFCTIQDG